MISVIVVLPSWRSLEVAQSSVKTLQITLLSDMRKLKQSYTTLSSKKDKEVSALLLEKDSLCSQMDIMQMDYAELLKNKKVEAAQATEAILKFQKSVYELKVLAQKKDDEIGRLQVEVVGTKKKPDKDFVHNQLSIAAGLHRTPEEQES